MQSTSFYYDSVYNPCFKKQIEQKRYSLLSQWASLFPLLLSLSPFHCSLTLSKGRAKSEDFCESQSFNLAALIRDMDLKVGEHGHETYCLKLASGV